jgi:homoserine kinase
MARLPLAVRVPASTSNLGPGFDCLGLALSLWLDVRVRGASDGPRHTIEHRGTLVEVRGHDLALAAFERGARQADVALAGGLAFEADSEIPVGRGFGSSGAAVAAGLLLANALAERPLATRELLGLGIELEGHPDNVTASLLGGCTLCHPLPEGLGPGGLGPAVLRPPVHPSLGFALAWPAFPLTTERARDALPPSYSLADARENARRLPFLLAGLASGDPELLAIGIEDRLHVAHRLPLIAGAERALEAAREAGAFAATISGAGSGLVALGPRERLEPVARAMEQALGGPHGPGASRVVEPVLGEPRVQRSASGAKPQ